MNHVGTYFMTLILVLRLIDNYLYGIKCAGGNILKIWEDVK